ncbi:unnamed protein product, partial [Discosporangium mesarthrocarpum]
MNITDVFGVAHQRGTAEPPRHTRTTAFICRNAPIMPGAAYKMMLPLVGMALAEAFLMPGYARCPIRARTGSSWTCSPRGKRERVVQSATWDHSDDLDTGNLDRESYSLQEYWDDFYTSGEAGDFEKGETYDWFFGYSRLAVHLNLHVGGTRDGRVLVLGCGNSDVSPKMYQDGWKNIVNIDFSEPLIKAMEELHQDKPGMTWKVMDARDMSELQDASFDVIVDKGLTDSLMHSDDFREHISNLSMECTRLLKPGGVYLLVDHRDPNRLGKLFQGEHWVEGSIREATKITSNMRLLKGKRVLPDGAQEASFAVREDELFSSGDDGNGQGAGGRGTAAEGEPVVYKEEADLITLYLATIAKTEEEREQLMRELIEVERSGKSEELAIK